MCLNLFFLKVNGLKQIKTTGWFYNDKGQTNAASDLLLNHGQSNGHKGVPYGQGIQLIGNLACLQCNPQLMKYTCTRMWH